MASSVRVKYIFFIMVIEFLFSINPEINTQDTVLHGRKQLG